MSWTSPEEKNKDPLRVAQYYYDTFGKNQYTKRLRKFSSKAQVNQMSYTTGKNSTKTYYHDKLWSMESQFESGLLITVADDKDIPHNEPRKMIWLNEWRLQ